MFSPTALDGALKPEAQVCLWAWGGIGPCGIDGEKRRWQLPTPPLRRAARASAEPCSSPGQGWRLLPVPSSGIQFDGLHATGGGCVGVGISGLQRV